MENVSQVKTCDLSYFEKSNYIFKQNFMSDDLLVSLFHLQSLILYRILSN